jgi:hypothetical protein
MGQVYECGLFTITSNISLENQTWKAPPPPSPPRPGTMVPSYQDSFIHWISTIPREGPLSRRAWCLQEQYLSPRLLHIFAGPIWIWECNSIITASNSTGLIERIISSTEYEAWAVHQRVSDLCGHRTMLGIESGIDRATALRFWDTLLNDYSNRALTYETDRLPALAGLASKVQRLLNSRYLAGIWECDLHGLMWVRLDKKWLWVCRNDDNSLYFWTGYSDSDNDTSTTLESQSSDQDVDVAVASYAESQSSEDSESAQESYLGPSWSWVSIVGPVEMPIRGPSLKDFTARSKAGCRFSPELVYSSVVVDSDNLLGKAKEGSQITILAHLLILGTSGEDILVCFDHKRHCSPSLEDYKLLMIDLNKKSSKMRSTTDHLRIWGLILWNANPSLPKLFSRVGVFSVGFNSYDEDDGYLSERTSGYRRKRIDGFKEKYFKMMDFLWDNRAISDKMEFTLI